MVVAHMILVSAPVPLELGLTGVGLGLGGLWTGLDNIFHSLFIHTVRGYVALSTLAAHKGEVVLLLLRCCDLSSWLLALWRPTSPQI